MRLEIMQKIASLNCTHPSYDEWYPDDRIIVVCNQQGFYELLLESTDEIDLYYLSKSDIVRIYRYCLNIVRNKNNHDLYIDDAVIQDCTFGEPYIKALRFNRDGCSIDVDLSQVLQIFGKRKRRK
jgi:hypothetical protein